MGSGYGEFEFKQFRDDMRLAGFSNNTIESYIYHNLRFLSEVKKSPREVSSTDIKGYLLNMIDKGQQPRTINLVHSALKHYYDTFMGRKLFYSIRRTKLNKLIPTVLSKDEIRSMIGSCRMLKHRLLISLMYATGLRVGECVRLKLDDLSLDNDLGIVRCGKGKKDRYFTISDRLREQLVSYLEQRKDNNPYLFNSDKGHITERTAQVIVKNASVKANIRTRTFCHALRSSLATHLKDNGTDIMKIQKVLGHANINTTRNYIRTTPGMLKNINNPYDASEFN